MVMCSSSQQTVSTRQADKSDNWTTRPSLWQTKCLFVQIFKSRQLKVIHYTLSYKYRSDDSWPMLGVVCEARDLTCFISVRLKTRHQYPILKGILFYFALDERPHSTIFRPAQLATWFNKPDSVWSGDLVVLWISIPACKHKWRCQHPQAGNLGAMLAYKSSLILMIGTIVWCIYFNK